MTAPTPNITQQIRGLIEQLTCALGELEQAKCEDGASERQFHPPFLLANRHNADLEQAHQRSRPSLPNPGFIRGIIRMRRLRERFFEAELFADPAWDMLLDLAAARGERSRVSVTSLCIASGVPTTTALNWIRQMTDAGLLVRIKDVNDGRRAFIMLSDTAVDALASYFHNFATVAANLAETVAKPQYAINKPASSA